MDTIFALASARGKAGIAVVRLSGPGAHGAVARLCGRLPEARRAALRRLSWQGEALDEALVLIFDAGASFTGEASAELHLHGATAVIGAVRRWARGTLRFSRFASSAAPCAGKTAASIWPRLRGLPI
ncbi:MAG: hypothetical protein R3D56_15130 [Paracoccaceae bacterium]